MRHAGLALLIVACATAARAHNFAFTDVTLALRADGTYQAELTCDLDALALGVASTTDSAALAAEIEALDEATRGELVERLTALLQRRVRVRFDGVPAEFEVSYPGHGQPAPEGQPPSALGVVARLHGRIPAGAREVTFFASRAFPPVRLTFAAAGLTPTSPEVLEPGGESRRLRVAGATPAPSHPETFRRFLLLGVTHIVPWGYDHVLFVLGLALLGSRIAPLLAQVTAFTLAHTLTLALASYGVVQLPARVVEPLIALSIVYVGVENAFAPRLRASRLLLVFGFGLLHGLGFAGVLHELGLPAGGRLTALLAFNLGVELGQLAVIACAALALVAWTRLGRTRESLARPASLAIAAAGLVFFVQRLAS